MAEAQPSLQSDLSRALRRGPHAAGRCGAVEHDIVLASDTERRGGERGRDGGAQDADHRWVATESGLRLEQAVARDSGGRATRRTLRDDARRRRRRGAAGSAARRGVLGFPRDARRERVRARGGRSTRSRAPTALRRRALPEAVAGLSVRVRARAATTKRGERQTRRHDRSQPECRRRPPAARSWAADITNSPAPRPKAPRRASPRARAGQRFDCGSAARRNRRPLRTVSAHHRLAAPTWSCSSCSSPTTRASKRTVVKVRKGSTTSPSRARNASWRRRRN